MHFDFKKTIINIPAAFGLIITVFSLGSVADENRRDGAVYAMSNKADGNEVIAYERATDGTLTYLDTYLTTGLGTGSGGPDEIDPVDALGSQNPLILSNDKNYLFAVNADSDNISTFRVNRITKKLTLTNVVESGGEFPVSLTIFDDILYVLNSAGEANISGFYFNDETGILKPIENSIRSLNFVGDDSLPRFLVSPAQISFSNDGKRLVVTVKGSNSIHVFSVSDSGVPSEHPVTSESEGSTPFGFGFSRNDRLLVAEAFGAGDFGEPNVSAVTSYKINDDNTLSTISSSVPNGQFASCWLVTNTQIPFLYTTNNQSHTISGYKVNHKGALSLLDDTGVTALTGNFPVDVSLTKHGQYMYAVNAGAGTISMYKVNKKSGALYSLGEIDGLPEDEGAVGIAAW